MPFRFAPLYIFGLGLLIGGCSAPSTIVMKPATAVYHDVFTCKGLTEDKRWVGVTDQFLPETDPRVVVVAQLAKEDKQHIIYYELTNPLDSVVLTETVRYPRENPLGVYFEMDRMLQVGGEGEWRATVYADGIPIGESIFYVGEKTEEQEEGAGRYFVVEEDATATDKGDEIESLSKMERLGNYIHEVTEELDIPLGGDDTLLPDS